MRPPNLTAYKPADCHSLDVEHNTKGDHCYAMVQPLCSSLCFFCIAKRNPSNTHTHTPPGVCAGHSSLTRTHHYLGRNNLSSHPMLFLLHRCFWAACPLPGKGCNWSLWVSHGTCWWDLTLDEQEAIGNGERRACCSFQANVSPVTASKSDFTLLPNLDRFKRHF